MSKRTFNQMIADVMTDAEETEIEVEETSSVPSPAASKAVAPVPSDEVEKLASALEFLGTRGVANFLEKQAAAPETNKGKQPGGSGSVSTQGAGTRTHHPALASNSAAIGYDKKEKAKQESPALKQVLKETPFADPTLKQKLTGAGGKGDKNIHSKTASDATASPEPTPEPAPVKHNLEAIRAELARRVAAAKPVVEGEA